MSEIAHQPCPFPACGSSDAFSFNDDKGIGLCHSCGESYPSKNKTFDWAKSAYPPPEKKVNVKQIPVVSSTYEDIRGLDPEVAKIYGIQKQLDADGVPVRFAFKHKANIKYRGVEEKVFWTKETGIEIVTRHVQQHCAFNGFIKRRRGLPLPRRSAALDIR